MWSNMYFVSDGMLYGSRLKLAQGMGLSPDTVRNWFRNGEVIHVYKDLTVYRVHKLVKEGTRNRKGNEKLNIRKYL